MQSTSARGRVCRVELPRVGSPVMSKRKPHRWLRHICRGETADLWLALEGRERFVAKVLRPYPGETEDAAARQFELELELHQQLRSSERFLRVRGVGEAPHPVIPSRRCRFMRSAADTGASLEQMLCTDNIRSIEPELVNYICYEAQHARKDLRRDSDCGRLAASVPTELPVLDGAVRASSQRRTSTATRGRSDDATTERTWREPVAQRNRDAAVGRGRRTRHQVPAGVVETDVRLH